MSSVGAAVHAAVNTPLSVGVVGTAGPPPPHSDCRGELAGCCAVSNILLVVVAAIAVVLLSSKSEASRSSKQESSSISLSRKRLPGWDDRDEWKDEPEW